MRFQGRLWQAGRVVLEDAAGALLGPPAAGRPHWWGELSVPPRRLLAAGTYRLELGDGRAGDVRLEGVASGPDAPALVTFTGCGRLS